MLKFVVVSDLHIVPEGTLSHALCTTTRMRECIAFINEHHADAEFVVFAGDLADHGEEAAYVRFKDTLTGLGPRAVLTLGNHDDRETFFKVFPGTAGPTGQLDHVIDSNGQRVIVLDTKDAEMGGAGRLSDDQLDWLKGALAEAADRPVIVVLHHNIAPFHVQTDFIILDNRDALAEVLATHPDIRHVISGHVHMTVSGTVQGIPFTTLAGAHYNIEPVLTSRSGPVPGPVPRREGPGQIAVVLSDGTSTVVHMENFLDRHPVMAQELFGWSSLPD